MIFHKKDENNSRIALIDAEGGKKTYGELDAQTVILAGVLRKRSVVVMTCDVSMETVSIFYSALQLGVVPVLLDPKTGREHIRSIISEYRPEYCWFKAETDEIPHLMKLEPVFVCSEHILYKTGYEKCEINPELALMLTTSGSTGSSKMVRISYGSIEQNIKILVNAMDITQNDRGIVSLPIHHCLGLSLINILLYAGGSVVLYEDSILNPVYNGLINRWKVTVTFLVPYSIEMLRMTDLSDRCYDSMRCVMIGGGKLACDDRQVWLDFCDKHGIISVFGYGQTEGTGYLSGIDLVKQISCDHIGMPPDGIKTGLSGRDCKGVGELVFEGDSISLGYASGYKDLIRGNDNNGILYTGDMASIDKHGNIFLKGRKKRIIKLLGERISLDEVELYLKNRFPLCDFACVEAEDQLFVIYDKESISISDIIKDLNRELRIHRNMVNTVFISQIPRLSNGKTDYEGITGKVTGRSEIGANQ